MRETTSKIMGVLNHPPSTLQRILEKNDVEFQLVLDDSQVEKFKSAIIYGFVSSETLFKSIKKLKRPPILWDSPSTFNHITLSQPISILDAKIMRDGIIIFEPLKKDKIYAFLEKKFEPLDTQPNFGKIFTKQLGNDSEFSKLLNKLLLTFPEYVYEPTIVAITTACEQNDFTIFSGYLNNNRLITNINKSDYKELSDYLKSIRPYIQLMVSKENKKELAKLDKEIKNSLKRIKFFIGYFGTKTLNSYLDFELAVNCV